jgi:hypothetical protein
VESEARREVWAALSWPYLDTTPDASEIDEAVATLVSSGLTLADLRRIDRCEVGPALWGQAFYGRWTRLNADPDDPSIMAIDRRLSRSRPRKWLAQQMTAPIRHFLTAAWWRDVTPRIQMSQSQRCGTTPDQLDAARQSIVRRRRHRRCDP